MATPVVELDASTRSSPMFNSTESSAGLPPGEAQPSGSHGGSSSAKYSGVPHIRSRVTVVCAECKRLKLKCDRRTPCSSCLKRDTVQRCIYSQAAAEKIDIQSLHNRLLVVEGHLAQLTSGSLTTLASLPPFKSSYPGSIPPQPLPSSSSQADGSLYVNTDSSTTYPPNDNRALLISGSSGSSVVVSLDSTAGLWLGEIDTPSILDDTRPSVLPSLSGRSGTNAVRVKLEPTSTTIPNIYGASSSSLVSSAGNNSGFVPPIPYSVFLPVIDTRLPRGPASNVPSPGVPQVTPALLRYLPSTPSIRTRYMQGLTELMYMHPCINMPHFEKRLEAMFSWGQANDSTNIKRDLARELFLGAGAKKSEKEKHHRGAPPPPSTSPRPTLSFFAVTCAAYALGALMTGDVGSDSPTTSTNTASSSSSTLPGEPSEEEIRRRSTNPAALLALSEQALSLFEKTSAYDLDSVLAMLLQVLCALHDGQVRVAQTVFPLVGKMVGVARMMGLGVDPDEFPGTYGWFEAEVRRRVWWDVCYYDLLVADCMGQEPLIPEGSFTTRLPADVDEDTFGPLLTTAPTSAEGGETYLGLRCRLVQLLKRVRRQAMNDPADNEASVEHASFGEQQVAMWLSELPEAFRLDTEVDVTRPLASCPSTTPFLMAQQCELVVSANRAVLKLYMPLIKDPASSGSPPSQQVLKGTVHAAEAIIHASRVLHTLWRDTRPSALNFYDYHRALFDAAVVCAYAAIQQPKSALAAEAFKGLSGALEVMRIMERSKNGGAENGHAPSEALRIVELMEEKAERARAADSSTSAGTKRKRTEAGSTRESNLGGGFQLPYVGPSVSSVKPEPSRVPPLSSKIAAVAGARRDSTSNPHEAKAAKTSSSSEKKSKEKSSKYPTIGIRIRTPQNSATPPNTAAASSRNHRPIAPEKIRVQIPASPPDRSQQSSTVSSHSAVPYPYPQLHPTPAPAPPPQQEPPSAGPMMHEFQMEFNVTPAPAAAEHHGVSHHTDSSPGSSAGYECSQPPPSVASFDTPHPQPAPSFHPGPSLPPPPPPQDSYMSASSYTPHPSGYEHPQQNMGISAPYGMSSSLSNGVTSIPGTPRDSYMVPSDKSAPGQFDSHVPKLDRQISAEYHPGATSHSHGMPMTATSMTTPYVQGWRPDDSWDYDKYYYNQHV